VSFLCSNQVIRMVKIIELEEDADSAAEEIVAETLSSSKRGTFHSKDTAFAQLSKPRGLRNYSINFIFNA
jgi:hypothetical protein